MKYQNIVLSLTITSIIAGTALTPLVAMKRQHNDDKEIQEPAVSKKQKTIDTVTMPEFFENLPNEINDHIGQFIESIPQDLDFENHKHVRIIHTIWKLREINKHFSDILVPLCLRKVQSIRISNNLIENQKKFDSFVVFLGSLQNLNFIDVNRTGITDQQLTLLLRAATANKKNIQLRLNYCQNLLKPTIENIPTLINLQFSWCENLQAITLRNLPALTNLDIIACTALENVTPINLPALTSLELNFCDNPLIVNFKNIHKLTHLGLRISDINDNTLTTLFNQGTLRNTLHELDFFGCPNLKNPSFDNLTTLTNLSLSECLNIEKPSLTNLPKLTHLDLSLTGITDDILANKILNQGTLGHTLISLDISYCKNLHKPTIGNLTNLTHLALSGNNITDDDLNTILNQGALKNTLQELNIKDTHMLQTPNLDNMPKLTSLNLAMTDISDTNLNTVLNQKMLKNTLRTLILFDNVNLKNPNLSNLNMLKFLDINGCNNITKVQLSTATKFMRFEQTYPNIHFVYVNNQ